MATKRLNFAQSNISDIAGRRFGKRVAIRPINPAMDRGGTIWEFVCDCGKRGKASISCLKQLTGCGCGVAEANRKGKRRTHNMTGTTEHLLWASAKSRAKRRHIPFSISIYDINVPTTCPLLGITLKRNTAKGNRDTSPTLDRIIPSAGYVKNNVMVISHKANRGKATLSLGEMELLVANWQLLGAK